MVIALVVQTPERRRGKEGCVSRERRWRWALGRSERRREKRGKCETAPSGQRQGGFQFLCGCPPTLSHNNAKEDWPADLWQKCCWWSCCNQGMADSCMSTSTPTLSNFLLFLCTLFSQIRKIIIHIFDVHKKKNHYTHVSLSLHQTLSNFILSVHILVFNSKKFYFLKVSRNWISIYLIGGKAGIIIILTFLLLN